MKKLLKRIEKQNLSIVELATRVDLNYTEAYNLRHEVIPKLEKAYCAVSERNKELFEMGEACIESAYWYEYGIDFEKFENTLKRDTERSDIKDLYLELSPKIFKMEKTKYIFRAYKRVLTDNLGMMDYNYNKPKEQWL